MSMDLQRDGDVYVLHLRDGENRMNRAFVDGLHRVLDTIERAPGAAALVTTGAGKFYSNGLDLDWMGGDGQAEAATFVDDLLAVFGRLVVLDVPTVAAINGHAFAAGGMFALAHDWRVMRADRGFFCLPEVDIGLPLAPGMTALIRERLAGPTARDAVLTGARWGGAECQTRGVVDDVASEGEVLSRAVARAALLAAKDRATLGALKRGLYAELHASLTAGR